MANSTILKLEKKLSKELNSLKFSKPVAHVYNPIDYAWDSFSQFTENYGSGSKKVLFVGMNPGPFGMAQTGVPFGEVSLVKDWLKIKAKVKKPKSEHPKRPIQGFDCTRSEISGQRLWGYFKEAYKTPRRFFKNHHVVNYCNLIFMETSGKNITPDKLPLKVRNQLYSICDNYLEKKIQYYSPDVIIGIGKFAEARTTKVLGKDSDIAIRTVLHPSPASPIANRGWAPQADKQLKAIYKELKIKV